MAVTLAIGSVLTLAMLSAKKEKELSKLMSEADLYILRFLNVILLCGWHVKKILSCDAEQLRIKHITVDGM